jgi:hypothetical protein
MGTRMTVVTLLLLAGCGGRSLSWSDAGFDDVTVTPTDGPTILPDTLMITPDQAVPLRDDAGGCGGPELQMGLVTNVFDGAPKTTLELSFPGEIAYHGPLTQPLASSPLLDHEIQVLDVASGAKKIIQYYLPAGLELPLTVSKGSLYTVIVQRRFIPGQTFTEALVIKGNTPGPWPFVVIMEPATYGQALDPDDPLISPLTVELLESSACPGPSSPGCPPLYIDRLRFEATTGAGLIAAELNQREVIGLTLFGHKMRIANVASWHQRPACSTGVETRMRYLLVAE